VVLPPRTLAQVFALVLFSHGQYRASALFVDSALAPGRSASADDSHHTAPFRVTYDEEATFLGKSKREEAALALGMIGVEGNGQRIREDGGRLFERDFVVTQIRGGLLRISRELHTLILRGTCFPYV